MNFQTRSSNFPEKPAFFRCFLLVEFTVEQLFDWSGSFVCFLLCFLSLNWSKRKVGQVGLELVKPIYFQLVLPNFLLGSDGDSLVLQVPRMPLYFVWSVF